MRTHPPEWATEYREIISASTDRDAPITRPQLKAMAATLKTSLPEFYKTAEGLAIVASQRAALRRLRILGWSGKDSGILNPDDLLVYSFLSAPLKAMADERCRKVAASKWDWLRRELASRKLKPTDHADECIIMLWTGGTAPFPPLCFMTDQYGADFFTYVLKLDTSFEAFRVWRKRWKLTRPAFVLLRGIEMHSKFLKLR